MVTVTLPPGLYESLITLGLRDAIDAVRADGWAVDVEQIDEALLADMLADHVRVATRRAISTIGGDDRPAQLASKIDVINRLLAVLADVGASGSIRDDDTVAADGESLRLVRSPTRSLLPPTVLRPHVSLRESALLVNGHRDYQVGAEVAREIVSSDKVDLLCAFVRFAGLRLVRDQLDEFVRRGGQLRVIASVYTGTTEKRALDEIVRLGGRVKVSYETAQTRLHAKAWLFERASGFHTAYIGSSNLTRSALVEGLEWNVRVSAVDNAGIVERVRATFEQYWNDPAFTDYDPDRDGETLQTALARQRKPEPVDGIERLVALNLDLAPLPHQAAMLEELATERLRGHKRNLVVAATGTGKTWVSAFDYRSLRESGAERLLFVAHRDEILRQSQLVFQLVLRDASFGERFVGGDRPVDGTHVFASIQSLHRYVDGIAPDAWDVVVVDEFHHAESATYQKLLERLRPKHLIGLTATPERADGRSILGWFDNRIACEIRLWDALEQGLLCPFHYFGTYDGSDLRSVSFRRGQYAVGELETIYLSDRERAIRILQAVERLVPNLDSMRALGFCVSVAHAKFMAERFNAAGLAAVALHAASAAEERSGAIGKLRRGELRAIFTVDLFNEGVDIPEVDTVLLLRPTESSTVFLQQLGRGLRRTPGKSVLTVLDFIGQAHAQYRFDIRFRALIGGTRQRILRAVEEGFPLTPPGSAIQLDRLSSDAVIANLRAASWSTRRALAADLRELGPDVHLGEFLSESGRELSEVYARPGAGHSFTRLRAEAFPELRLVESRLDHALGRLLHVNDDERLDRWVELMHSEAEVTSGGSNAREVRLGMMLFAALGYRREPIARVSARIDELANDTARRQEVIELLTVLRDRSRVSSVPLDVADVPLHSHAAYGLYEVLAAFGATSSQGVLRDTREGVLWLADAKTDLLFVTLEKGESEYSPTTRYNDYPISPTLFHWESQSTTSTGSPTGQRYVAHRSLGSRVILFVRERKRDARGETVPYTCLGFVQHANHESDRPMQIVWELERPMPAWLYQDAKVAAG